MRDPFDALHSTLTSSMLMTVMVVGHSACGGCIAAYHAPAPTPAEPPHNALTRFLDPLVKLRHSLPEGSSVDDLIEANVKLSVANLAKSEVSESPVVSFPFGRSFRSSHGFESFHIIICDVCEMLCADCRS